MTYDRLERSKYFRESVRSSLASLDNITRRQTALAWLSEHNDPRDNLRVYIWSLKRAEKQSLPVAIDERLSGLLGREVAAKIRTTLQNIETQENNRRAAYTDLVHRRFSSHRV